MWILQDSPQARWYAQQIEMVLLFPFHSGCFLSSLLAKSPARPFDIIQNTCWKTRHPGLVPHARENFFLSLMVIFFSIQDFYEVEVDCYYSQFVQGFHWDGVLDFVSCFFCRYCNDTGGLYNCLGPFQAAATNALQTRGPEQEAFLIVLEAGSPR